MYKIGIRPSLTSSPLSMYCSVSWSCTGYHKTKPKSSVRHVLTANNLMWMWKALYWCLFYLWNGRGLSLAHPFIPGALACDFLAFITCNMNLVTSEEQFSRQYPIWGKCKKKIIEFILTLFIQSTRHFKIHIGFNWWTVQHSVVYNIVYIYYNRTTKYIKNGLLKHL